MYIFLIVISKLSAFAPILIIFLIARKWKSLLWWYILVGGMAELVSYILKDGFGLRMDIAANIYLALELFFYSYFFYYILVGKKWWIFFCLIVILEGFFLYQSMDVFLTDQNMFAVGLNCLVFIIGSMLVYKRILEKQEYANILHNPVFWINSGIFIYASGGSIFFIFLERVRSEDISFLIQLWLTFYCLINLIRYTFIGIGLNRLAYNERI